MRSAIFPVLTFLLLFLLACQPSPPEATTNRTLEPAPVVESTSETPFVNATETGHKVGSFREHAVVSADVILNFGGTERLRGTMSMLTNTGKLRIEEESGRTTVFDGSEVYVTPDSMAGQGARFGIFTWTYFLALPYKLDDPGTIWTDTPFNTLDGKEYGSKKLSFEDGTGDSSLDWYIVYTDQETDLIECAAYIVTYGATQEEAEVDPHAITYADYRVVDGIPIAHEWKFWAWREEGGLTKQLGDASLRNVRFLEETPEMFSKPEDGTLVPYMRPE